MAHKMTDSEPELARRLGLFDATMIVMGGIIGSGIFMNPSVVALQVHTPFLILGAWFLGGLFALAAAFIWAELAALRPDVGGQYAYLREAFHPGVAFVYGWVLLLVIQTGGMAAVAVTFARYFVELTNIPIEHAYFAAIVLAVLTLINCFGVRAGSTVQSILMVLKIVAIAMLVSEASRARDAAKMAGYICGLVLLEHSDAPWLYALLRFVETILGVLVAWGISYVPKLIRTDRPPPG